MLTRRVLFAAPLAATLVRALDAQEPAASAMQLAMHQNTSRAAGFRRSLEGWAQAGIRQVELTDVLLDQFLQSDTLQGARRLLADLNLTPASAAAVLPDVWIPGPARAASLETWRRRCEQFAALGLEKLYYPSITTRPGHSRRLRRNPRLHPRSRRHHAWLRAHRDDRVRAHVNAPRNLTVDSQSDSRGRARRRSADA